MLRIVIWHFYIQTLMPWEIQNFLFMVNPLIRTKNGIFLYYVPANQFDKIKSLWFSIYNKPHTKCHVSQNQIFHGWAAVLIENKSQWKWGLFFSWKFLQSPFKKNYKPQSLHNYDKKWNKTSLIIFSQGTFILYFNLHIFFFNPF